MGEMHNFKCDILHILQIFCVLFLPSFLLSHAKKAVGRRHKKKKVQRLLLRNRWTLIPKILNFFPKKFFCSPPKRQRMISASTIMSSRFPHCFVSSKRTHYHHIYKTTPRNSFHSERPKFVSITQIAIAIKIKARSGLGNLFIRYSSKIMLQLAERIVASADLFAVLAA